MSNTRFTYVPRCCLPGCERPAQFKLAAIWSDGAFDELKTYGFSCEVHIQTLKDAAEERRKWVRLLDGESLDTIQPYPLQPQPNDAGR